VGGLGERWRFCGLESFERQGNGGDPFRAPLLRNFRIASSTMADLLELLAPHLDPTLGPCGSVVSPTGMNFFSAFWNFLSLLKLFPL
jgi:hypothetical protein